MNDLECKKCSGVIIKSYGDEAKLRSKLVKWNKDGMFAVCKSCGHENPITTDVVKSLEAKFEYEVSE